MKAWLRQTCLGQKTRKVPWSPLSYPARPNQTLTPHTTLVLAKMPWQNSLFQRDTQLLSQGAGGRRSGKWPRELWRTEMDGDSNSWGVQEGGKSGKRCEL